MARYLVVAHQTATSPELLERLKGLARDVPRCDFVLLVPATPAGQMLVWTEGQGDLLALRAANRARTHMERAGLKIARIAVGDASPLQAVDDEMRENAEQYDGIVICTLPVGVSRWLGLDLPHRVERKYPMPVIHVTAQPPVPAQ